MKKFSNITNQSVGQEPKIESIYNEKDIFRFKILKLMEDFLKIQTYGPVDRYQKFGTISIKGKEMAADAIISLFENDDIEKQTNLLESLKVKINDWKTIDDKINELKKEKSNFKIDYKLDKIIERYGNDEDFLVKIIIEKVSKIKDIDKISSYINSINKSKISDNSKNTLNFLFKKYA